MILTDKRKSLPQLEKKKQKKKKYKKPNRLYCARIIHCKLLSYLLLVNLKINANDRRLIDWFNAKKKKKCGVKGAKKLQDTAKSTCLSSCIYFSDTISKKRE